MKKTLCLILACLFPLLMWMPIPLMRRFLPQATLWLLIFSALPELRM